MGPGALKEKRLRVREWRTGPPLGRHGMHVKTNSIDLQAREGASSLTPPWS